MVVENAGGAGNAATSGDTGGAGAATGAGGAGASSSEGAGATGGAGQATALDPAAAGAGATGGEGDAGKAPAAYAPNFKYKVLKEEKEIPEWARPFVTSADVEKNVRELFEKADGIEAVKTHRDQLVVGHLQRGDLDIFFEALNIPEATVLKYALYRLQLKENPQQFAAHEQMRQIQLQNLQLQQQLEQSNSGYTNIAVQTREMQLDTHLGRPELLTAVQSFDQRVGKPGAFRTEVIKRGKMYAAMEQDAPVEQVVSEVLQLIGWQGQSTQAQPNVQNGAGAAAAPAAGAGTPAAGQAKPTLPNVRGKGTSPAQKVFKSTEELRKHARQMGT
jgi:hypothetical protein